MVVTRREIITGIAAMALLPSAERSVDTMEQRMSLLTLGVKDLARSKRFYADGLGWRPALKTRNCVLPGRRLGLRFVSGGGTRQRLQCRLSIVWSCPHRDGIQRSHERGSRPSDHARRALALRFLKPARDAVWGGYSGYFADPDGFAWEIAWNPAWKLEADGPCPLSNPGRSKRRKIRACFPVSTRKPPVPCHPGAPHINQPSNRAWPEFFIVL